MPDSRDDIDHLRREIARLSAANRRLEKELDRAYRMALRWRWVAEQIHKAAQG